MITSTELTQALVQLIGLHFQRGLFKFEVERVKYIQRTLGFERIRFVDRILPEGCGWVGDRADP